MKMDLKLADSDIDFATSQWGLADAVEAVGSLQSEQLIIKDS